MHGISLSSNKSIKDKDHKKQEKLMARSAMASSCRCEADELLAMSGGWLAVSPGICVCTISHTLLVRSWRHHLIGCRQQSLHHIGLLCASPSTIQMTLVHVAYMIRPQSVQETWTGCWSCLHLYISIDTSLQ